MRYLRWGLMAGAVGLLLYSGGPTHARQTDPCAGQPATGACASGRADVSKVTLAGTFTYDWSDGAGGDLSYGGTAMGVSEDGQYLYIACNVANPQRGLAKFAIPTTLGTMASVAAPCQGPTENDIKQIIPGWGAGQAILGGILEQGGRVVVSGYASYDANGVSESSHWSGSSLTSLTGPWKGTIAPGQVKGHMAPIPTEWRALLGGPAYAAADYTSIISQQSYGLAISVFDPTTVTANNFPMTMLIGCPHSVPSCRTWTSWGPSTNGFEGTELAAGSFIIPGTRTLAAIEREASGTIPPGGTVPYEGYGYRTDTLALHGQPYTVNPAEGVRWIYTLADPLNIKGNKGYPYKLVVKLYDLYEAWQVKQGQKSFDQVKPYAVVNLPGSSAGEFVSSGAYNPVRKEYYLLRNVLPGVNTVYVFRGWGEGTSGGGSGPPPTTPPLAVADTYSMQADTTLTVNAPGVLTNDQNAPTSASVVTPPASGTFTLNADGSFTYTPPGGFTGDRTFTYNATNAGGSSQATVTITVQPGATPPPPASELTVSATTTCRVVLTATPPSSTGWRVQFTYARTGEPVTNFGSRDSAAPFSRTRTLGMGTYTLAGTWTKEGQSPVSITGRTFVCPAP